MINAEQPVKNADLYFMSTSLQKENDESGAKIICLCVEALDPKQSRMLVRDLVMDGGDPLPEDANATINGKTVNKGPGVYMLGWVPLVLSPGSMSVPICR
jgi:hypothetical protein